MIPYDVDPSLHSGEPQPAVLDDGFSPLPARQPVPPDTAPAGVQAPLANPRND